MASSRPPQRGGGQQRRKGPGQGQGSGPGGPRRPGRPGQGGGGGAGGSRRPQGQAQQRGPKRSNAARSKPPEPGREGEERLQKILAHAGIGSRRACEELILQGRISIDGKVVRELGTKVDPNKSTIALDGQKIREERHVYFAVYKPKGYVSTNNDPSGRPRVLDLLPEVPQRVYTIGRLDESSTGLILLTNDGELANKLAHPKFGVEKIYRVVVAGSPSKEVLDQLTEGIWLAEGKVRAKRVRIAGKRGESTILEMALAEGKNREVRRMLAKLGHKVMVLTRVAVGPITVKGLKAGDYRPLSLKEIELLQRAAAGEFVAPRGEGKPRRERSEGPPQGGSRRPGPPVPPSGPRSRREAGPAQGRDRRDRGPAPQGPRREGGGGGAGPRPRPEQARPTSRRTPPPPAPPRPAVEQDVEVSPLGEGSGSTRQRRVIGLDAPSSSSPKPKGRKPKPPRRQLGSSPRPRPKRKPTDGE